MNYERGTQKNVPKGGIEAGEMDFEELPNEESNFSIYSTSALV